MKARIPVVIGTLIAVVALAGCGALSPQAQEPAKPSSLIAEIKQKGELKVGYAVADPHQFKDPSTGEWKGIAVDMMKNWAEVLAVKHTPVDTSWETMIQGLEAGKYDVAAALNRRPPRSLVVTYSMPYMSDRGVFAVDKNKSDAKTWPDLNKAGQTVCVVQGTAEDKSMTAMGAAVQVQVLRLGDQNECRIALQSGKANAFFDDISGVAKYANEQEWVRMIVPDPVLQLEGVGFAIRKGYSYDDVQALDIQVETWVNNGILAGAQLTYGLPDWEPFTQR
jgi:polar amino acid transport system substrate-binding protein